MDQKQVARICSLESFAAKNPGIYRARVALLASLGYLYAVHRYRAAGLHSDDRFLRQV